MDKAVILIDAGYLNKVLEHFKVKIDYQLFSDELAKKLGCERFRTYYYDCMPYQSNPPTEEEKQRYSKKQKFIRRLERLDKFMVRLGRLQKINENGVIKFKQKEVDNLINLDIYTLSDGGKIDKIILISGDSDFAPALEYSRNKGISICIVYSPDIYIHDKLYSSVDERFKITKEFLESCRLRK